MEREEGCAVVEISREGCGEGGGVCCGGGNEIEAWRGTLRASLSGTFLQTLPDLVTPLKGALFISAQLSSDAVSALRKVRVLI